MTTFARVIAMAVTLNHSKDEEILVSRYDLLFLIFKALDMPSWVQYIAVDSDGITHGFENKPYAGVEYWIGEGKDIELFKDYQPNDLWEETLVYWKADIMNEELEKL